MKVVQLEEVVLVPNSYSSTIEQPELFTKKHDWWELSRKGSEKRENYHRQTNVKEIIFSDWPRLLTTVILAPKIGNHVSISPTFKRSCLCP